MLKGHVFSKQLFENQIFALFINTFLDGENGISNNYKNGMAVTYSGNSVTVDSGAAIIQGRPVEEESYTTISAGTDNAYCKLVIEIDLDKQNTESECNQISYKIIKGTSNYPNLTRTNIVKNNSGVYQYELARFRTSANGISDFQDKRTFLDFESIYNAIQVDYKVVLDQLKRELQNVEDGSAYVLKTKFVTIANTNLDDYITEGRFYFSTEYTPINIPAGVNGFLEVFVGNGVIKQLWYRHGSANVNDYETYIRTRTNGSIWSTWKRFATVDELKEYIKKSGDTMTGPLVIATDNFNAYIHRRTVNGVEYNTKAATGISNNEGCARLELSANGASLGGVEVRSDGNIYSTKSNQKIIEKGDIVDVTKKLQTPRNIALTGAVSGNVNFDGSGNVTINTSQTNIAVVTGAIQTDETGAGTANLEYPVGYTRENCMVLSLGMLINQTTQNWEYEADGDGYTHSVTLRNNSISVYFGLNGYSNKTAYLKLLLMKVS